MRALTMEELEFVSGGEDDPAEIVTVTGVPNGPTPGWGVLYPEDLAMLGLTISDYTSSGDFVLVAGGGSSSQAINRRTQQFLQNVKIERLANNQVRVTLNRDVIFSGNHFLLGGDAVGLVKAGSIIVGTDTAGGPRGRANGIPDFIDKALSYEGGVVWR